MEFGEIGARGLVMAGCGRMGTALLRGWIAAGLDPACVHVQEPSPSDWLRGSGVALNGPLPDAPAVVLVAVKPQVMDAALPGLAGFGGGGTLFVSVAAGIALARYEAALGAGTPVVRTMPNTPAAIGRGITALVGNGAVGPAGLDLAEALMSAVGETLRLSHEAQMDAVTAVSGSGPAYVFHMIEALAAAGVAAGLPDDLAMRLSRATVSGAGELALRSDEDAATLRANVTSPGGTTAAALAVLMDEGDGLPPLMQRAVAAAAARSRELSGPGS